MKLKGQLSGIGDIFKNDVHLGKVNYSLYVYQEILEANGEELEGLTNITGSIESEEADRFIDEEMLNLCIEDGRCIEFFVRDNDGNIRCSGGFFKKDM